MGARTSFTMPRAIFHQSFQSFGRTARTFGWAQSTRVEKLAGVWNMRRGNQARKGLLDPCGTNSGSWQLGSPILFAVQRPIPNPRVTPGFDFPCGGFPRGSVTNTGFSQGVLRFVHPNWCNILPIQTCCPIWVPEVRYRACAFLSGIQCPWYCFILGRAQEPGEAT